MTLSPDLQQVTTHFPLLLPEAFRRKIDFNDPRDPLLRQVLPTPEELSTPPGYGLDPLAEQNHQPRPGMLHKYAGRVLLLVTSACAIHCRYCFRRHRQLTTLPPHPPAWEPVLAAILADDSLREVILSGGDPLMMTPEWLGWLLTRLGRIPHLRRIRLHTRVPVVLPERLTPELLDHLGSTPLPLWVVIQTNHPHEVDEAVQNALRAMTARGVPLLNQSVLLRGVNDQVEILVALCETLVNNKVFPYYLHLLDPVAGTAHFEVGRAEALRLMRALHGRLPGYALPRLAREVAGEAGKRMTLGWPGL